MIKYHKTIELRKKFIELLLINLLKQKPNDIDANEIIVFSEDILQYLEDEIEEEYETNQQLVGMKEFSEDMLPKIGKGQTSNVKNTLF